MSRRPTTTDLDEELARMAPGGRLWSESPIRRPLPRVRQAGATAAANPWPGFVTFANAITHTTTSITWTYDPSPQPAESLSFALGLAAVPGSFYAVADTVTSTTETWPGDSPGGGSFRLYLTPNVVGLRTVTLHWSPATMIPIGDPVYQDEVRLVPRWVVP